MSVSNTLLSSNLDSSTSEQILMVTPVLTEPTSSLFNYNDGDVISSSRLSKETIIGIIFAVLFLLLIIVLILGYIFRQRFRKGTNKFDASLNLFYEVTSIEMKTDIGAFK